MRKTIIVIVAVAGLVTLVVGSVAFASSRGDGHRLNVIEHAVTDTVIDVGAPGDSTGDLLTFHNELFNASDTTVVGTDQGECVRIDPAAGTWECRWTNVLRGGQITVEGPFFDAQDSVLAVTGGTGRYRNVRGEMELTSLVGGTEFEFSFRLIGAQT